MKIFLVASECPPVAGGIASYVGNTASMFVDAGHKITVFARSNESRVLKDGNLTFIEIQAKDLYKISANGVEERSEKHPSFPYNVMGFWSALSYQLADEVINYIQKNGKPDVIETEDYSGLGYFLIQRKLMGCPELQGVPIILTLHSSKYMLYPANKMPSYQLESYWVGRMEKFCTLAADGIVAPTHYIANQARAAIGSSLDIEIIPLPVPKQFLVNEKLPQSQPNVGDIVYFGRLEVRKGVIELVKACSELWEKGIKFTLTAIGGDTWYHSKGCDVKTYLKQKYSKYINSGNLVIHPPLKHPELHKRVAQAWCVVIPSLWENFPNTCLEAMLLEKVVLASDSGGHYEMLVSGDMQAGFIFSWSTKDDFSTKLQKVLNLSIVENLDVGKKARETILKISGHEQVLEKRRNHIQKVIDKANYPINILYPSVNYLPHGKICYPKFLPSTDSEKGIISVCIPFYNHGKYIEETIDSVFLSNYPNLEIIILNDGSTETQSIEVLDKIQDKYQENRNFKIINQENQGVASARNKMAEIAKGEYLAFLDSDDKISPTFYSEAVKILNKYENVGFVASWIKEFGDSQGVWVAWNTEFPYLLCHNTLTVGTVVRKQAYLSSGGMNILLDENLEDYECWINMSKQGWLGVVIPQIHYFYRIHATSRLRDSNRDQLLYLYEVIASQHPELYGEYATEIFNLLNQNGASWLWSNPSKNSILMSYDMTGMEILSLLVNKIKRVYSDGGYSLISNRFRLLLATLFKTKFIKSKDE